MWCTIAPMIKTNIVLLNFAFKCRLVNETCAITLVQTGRQANQLASAVDHAANITNLTENRASKIYFFSQDSKEMCSLIFVFVITKVFQKNIPFMKTIHIMYVFFKGIMGKWTVTGMCVFSSIYIKLVNKIK